MLRSAAYCKYLEHKAEIIPIEELGWDLQIMFTSVEEELKMIREGAGFVDYSFNNMIAVVGNEAFKFLQRLVTNDVSKMSPGKVLYTAVLDDDGAIVDEITLFCLGENHYMYNGGIDSEKANEWLPKKAAEYDVHLIPTGNCLLSVQGPKSREILKDEVDLMDLNYYECKQTTFRDIPVMVARLGFSGELGYEFYFHYKYMSNVWDAMLEIGKPHGMGPYGLATTDVVAIEKGYLTPFDVYEGSSPLELGIGWAVKFDKGDFNGKDALLKRKEEGLKTKLIAFEVTEPGFELEPMMPVFKGDQEVGGVTHCGPGISVNKHFLGRAWVNIEHAKEGEVLEVEKDGKRVSVTVSLQIDWYDPGSKKVKA